MTQSANAQRFGWPRTVFALFVTVALFAVITPAVSAQGPESAISTGGAPSGIASPETGDDDDARILELQNRLSELLREQQRLTNELERRAAIEIASITDFWDTAIEELRAEVESEIEQVTSDFEHEAQRILSGTRRDGSLRSLKAELDAVIAEKWAWFDLESQMKQQYLRDDIAEIEHAKAFELDYISRLIHEIETELNELLSQSETVTDRARDTTPAEEPEPERLPDPDTVLDDEPADQWTEASDSEESGRYRGFFTNSIATDPKGLDWALEPTALAVIGILLTLTATGVQLLKGN